MPHPSQVRLDLRSCFVAPASMLHHQKTTSSRVQPQNPPILGIFRLDSMRHSCSQPSDHQYLPVESRTPLSIHKSPLSASAALSSVPLPDTFRPDSMQHSIRCRREAS